MKKVFTLVAILIVFTPPVFPQEKSGDGSIDSTISDGYKQIEKAKKDVNKSPDEKDTDADSDNAASQVETTPEKIYELQETSKRPLYNPIGKRDPFKPFIRAPKEEEVVITEATPPLKKYDLNEFRITGIVWIGNEPKAVVVDPEGNTYFLGKGDEIGNRDGEIVEVRENGLLVREKRYFEDVFGNRKVEIKNSILAFIDENE